MKNPRPTQPLLPMQARERGPGGSHFSPGFEAAFCSVCGSPELIAIAPGSAPAVAPGGFAVATGQPSRQWCRSCWPAPGGRAVPRKVSPP